MASCGSVVAPALVLADDDMSVGVRRGAVERFVHEGNIRRGDVGGESGREDPRCLRYDDACLESCATDTPDCFPEYSTMK